MPDWTDTLRARRAATVAEREPKRNVVAEPARPVTDTDELDNAEAKPAARRATKATTKAK